MYRSSRLSRRSTALQRGFAFCFLLTVLALTSTGGSIGEEAVSNDAMADKLAPFAPAILRRGNWQAKPARPGMKEQSPKAIILHHTGIKRNPNISFEAKLRGLQSFSQRPGQVSPKVTKPAWPDIPYHYYVDYSGRIAEGREVRYAGDTNTGYDTTNYIQVVVEGEFDNEFPAPEQIAALRDLLVWLMLSWDIPREKVSVHKDHAPTTCPGRHFMAILPQVFAMVIGQRNKVISEMCARGPSAKFSSVYCTTNERAPR
jgi:hypothetical protein